MSERGIDDGERGEFRHSHEYSPRTHQTRRERGNTNTFFPGYISPLWSKRPPHVLETIHLGMQDITVSLYALIVPLRDDLAAGEVH